MVDQYCQCTEQVNINVKQSSYKMSDVLLSEANNVKISELQSLYVLLRIEYCPCQKIRFANDFYAK